VNARTVVIAVSALALTGCYQYHAPHSLTTSERSQLYSAVLRDIRASVAERPVVLDTLVSSAEVDAEQVEQVTSSLQTNRKMLDAFLLAQRNSPDQFDHSMVPGVEWSVVTPRVVDSLRAMARADTTDGRTPQRTPSDRFWARWQRQFPRSGGYVSLSKASVSGDGQQAMIHVRIQCGTTCGQSELRLMKRDADGVWFTAKRVTLSVS
jgi:hypothetical protein